MNVPHIIRARTESLVEWLLDRQKPAPDARRQRRADEQGDDPIGAARAKPSDAEISSLSLIVFSSDRQHAFCTQ